MAHLVHARRSQGLALGANYDPIPSDVAQYGKTNMWDEFYMKFDDGFEWFLSYAALAGHFSQWVDKDARIFHAGCGNSTLCEDMFLDGYENIFNSDISRVVIDMMKEKSVEFTAEEIKPKEGMSHELISPATAVGVQWKQCDACELQSVIEDKCFDVVIDKGTLDSLYCSPDPKRATHKYLQEMDRILQPEGLFLCISYGNPEQRLERLDNADETDDGFLAWTVDVHAIPKPTKDPYEVPSLRESDHVYYIYFCRKNPKMDNEKDQKLKLIELAKSGKLPQKNARKKKKRKKR